MSRWGRRRLASGRDLEVPDADVDAKVEDLLERHRSYGVGLQRELHGVLQWKSGG